MGLLREIAEPLVARNVPIIPLRPKTKIAFLTNWQDVATTDPAKIEQWDQDYADANAACVAFARPDGVWFFEIDRPGLQDEIEKQTGQKFPETFIVRSSPGKGHFYWKQTPASIAMGNKQAADENGELWSARVDSRYVVAPGSYHPTSGKRYETLRDVPIVPAPDWLVAWCQRSVPTEVKTGHVELDSEEIISEGGRNSALTSILGKARQVLKMDREQLFSYGMSVNDKRCRPPLPETEVRTIANSISGYAIKEAGVLVFPQPVTVSQEPIEPVKIAVVPYPTFPRWVIKGTSVGKGLVEPICAINNSYPEFIFMPAMVLMLNYCALKVQVRDKAIIPSFYMISIGQKGRAFKSCGVDSATEYFGHMNYVKVASGSVKNAEGKTLIWTPGSTEGLGLEMARTNCKNAVMFYDEFKTLVDKASIEKSSIAGHISLMYESKLFSNTIKARKEQFSHEPNQYCASLIACTTDKAFPEQWSRMPSTSDMGLDDRFFFLYQPETFLPVKPKKYVNTVAGAVKTKELIDKAVTKRVYDMDEFPLEKAMESGKIGAREAGLVEKMALYFAIDLGKEEIDEDCIDRALALMRYGAAVKTYLNVFESHNKEAELQQKIIHALRRYNGAMEERTLERIIHPERYGTFMYGRAFEGLIRAGWITETGKGTKGEPTQIILMRLPAEDEDKK